MNINSISDPTYRNVDDQLCKAYETAENSSTKKAAEVASSSHQRGSPLERAKIDHTW